MQISKATLEDIETVHNLVVSHCRTLGITYDNEAIRNSLYSILSNNDNTQICFILHDGSARNSTGYIAAVLTASPVSFELHCVELGFYCETKGKGRELLNTLTQWAKDNGANFLCMSSHGTDRLDDYYLQTGFQVKEKIFVKELT